jgi:hypothetical protein
VSAIQLLWKKDNSVFFSVADPAGFHSRKEASSATAE